MNKTNEASIYTIHLTKGLELEQSIGKLLYSRQFSNLKEKKDLLKQKLTLVQQFLNEVQNLVLDRTEGFYEHSVPVKNQLIGQAIQLIKTLNGYINRGY